MSAEERRTVADALYQRYVRDLEQEHSGQFAAVSRQGEVLRLCRCKA
ncbi:MAG TPA: hypothetical protein VFA70_11040 [Dehalococcoidia bacterium]|jgi:hypothetical protein|nr:hypothetical protein [Dehalococcoidia bacterium]